MVVFTGSVFGTDLDADRPAAGVAVTSSLRARFFDAPPIVARRPRPCIHKIIHVSTHAETYGDAHIHAQSDMNKQANANTQHTTPLRVHTRKRRSEDPCTNLGGSGSSIISEGQRLSDVADVIGSSIGLRIARFQTHAIHLHVQDGAANTNAYTNSYIHAGAQTEIYVCAYR